MKMLLRRDQRQSVLGKMVFTLQVRAELSAEEREAISRYRLADTMLYEKYMMAERGTGLLGLIWRIAFHMRNVTVSIKDLVNGKKLECKDIVEMLEVEEQIREWGKTFNAILNAARQFGGEEVVDLAA